MYTRGIDMPQGENDPKHGRYAQAAKIIKRESWESDRNLPVKYWKALQDLAAVGIKPLHKLSPYVLYQEDSQGFLSRYV